MKGDKHCELDQHIKSISTTYLDDWRYQIACAIWNEKYFLSYCVYHKYTHGFFNLMVHNILQSDLHGFKCDYHSTYFSITWIIFSFAEFFEILYITCVNVFFIKLRIC
jgi:hypothetical protein